LIGSFLRHNKLLKSLAGRIEEWEDGIESLAQSIRDFRGTRKRKREIAAAAIVASGRRRPRESLPPPLQLTADRSTSFTQSFTRIWSCLAPNGGRLDHTAKLFLDSDVSNGCVNKRMVLEYGAREQRQSEQ